VQVGHSWQQRLAHVGRSPDPQPSELLLVGAPILLEPLLPNLGGLELSPEAVHGVADARALHAWQQGEDGLNVVSGCGQGVVYLRLSGRRIWCTRIERAPAEPTNRASGFRDSVPERLRREGV
jgi:hypothetical protein